MTAQPAHDTVTLKNVTGESDGSQILIQHQQGSILLLNSTKNQKKPIIEPVQPSGILGKLRSFLPKIATANQELNKNGAETLDVDVTKVESDIDESDTSTDDADSSEELESNEDEKPKVEFNLSLFRAGKTDEENDVDLKPEVEQVPEGFREAGDSESCSDSPVGKKPKRLVEEL